MGKMDSLQQLGGAFSQIGSAMDPNPDGMARRLGQAGYDTTQAEIMRREIERKQKEQEKKKKSGLGKMLGSTAGAILGTVIPGVGNVAGAALGSALGGAAGSKAMGGDITAGGMLQDALTGGISTLAAPAVLGAASNLPGGLGKGAAMLKDLPGTMGMGAADMAMAKGMDPNLWMKLAGGLGTGLQAQLVKPMLGQMMGGGMGGFGMGGFGMPQYQMYQPYPQDPYYGMGGMY